MHIPDNYLSPQTCGVAFAAMVPVWAVSIHKVHKELPEEKISYLGVAAAFSFIVMMFNVPMPGGTTGHAVGGTLIAVLFGPYAACIAVSVALLLQALLFGDGGILAFGANCFNMAFVLPFAGYAVYALIRKFMKNQKGDVIAAGIGSYVGLNAAALCAAIEFGIQPMLFRDGAGNAMYCPYGLNISVPAMMAGHLTVFGAAEVIFTVAVLGFVMKADPSLVKTENQKSSSRAIPVLLAVLMAATPLGLLAEGTAWGEWDTTEVTSVNGYTPSGMKHGFSWKALLPDYSLKGMPAWMAYVLSAVIGVSLLIIIFRMLSSMERKKAEA